MATIRDCCQYKYTKLSKRVVKRNGLDPSNRDYMTDCKGKDKFSDDQVGTTGQCNTGDTMVAYTQGSCKLKSQRRAYCVRGTPGDTWVFQSQLDACTPTEEACKPYTDKSVLDPTASKKNCCAFLLSTKVYTKGSKAGADSETKCMAKSNFTDDDLGKNGACPSGSTMIAYDDSGCSAGRKKAYCVAGRPGEGAWVFADDPNAKCAATYDVDNDLCKTYIATLGETDDTKKLGDTGASDVVQDDPGGDDTGGDDNDNDNNNKDDDGDGDGDGDGGDDNNGGDDNSKKTRNIIIAVVAGVVLLLVVLLVVVKSKRNQSGGGSATTNAFQYAIPQ
jgi:hypothetical protein